jgi:hypothetical protein
LNGVFWAPFLEHAIFILICFPMFSRAPFWNMRFLFLFVFQYFLRRFERTFLGTFFSHAVVIILLFLWVW